MQGKHATTVLSLWPLNHDFIFFHFDPTFIVLLQHVIFGLETACD